MRSITRCRWTNRFASLSVVVLATSVLMGVTAGTAAAGATCSGGPAIVFQGEGWREVQAHTAVGGIVGFQERYKVDNAGDNNIAVQVKGYDRPELKSPTNEIWKGFPLGPGGSFIAFVPWGNSLANPAIRVMNLGGRLGSSVSFEC